MTLTENGDRMCAVWRAVSEFRSSRAEIDAAQSKQTRKNSGLVLNCLNAVLLAYCLPCFPSSRCQYLFPLVHSNL